MFLVIVVLCIIDFFEYWKNIILKMKLIEILKNGGWGEGGVCYMLNEMKRVYWIKMFD